jgi:hypothetical protein
MWQTAIPGGAESRDLQISYFSPFLGKVCMMKDKLVM